MEENRSDLPFIVLDVDKNNKIGDLSKRFDELFPNTMVRLRIDGQYSPMFYMGAGKWAYRPKPKPKNKALILECKLYHEDRVEDYLDFSLHSLIDKYDISIKYLKLVGDVKILDKEYNGLIITDGRYVIIDQALIENGEELAALLEGLLMGKKIYSSANSNENGIIILYSRMNILGSEND